MVPFLVGDYEPGAYYATPPMTPANVARGGTSLADLLD